jgi:hypothetical protein
MKPLKTMSKPILQNVIICRYREITLKILKEKHIKSINMKAHLDFSITYPLGTKHLTNKKKSFQKNF